jgi:gamma-glutamyltranspeptidase/glutathione hydrolase
VDGRRKATNGAAACGHPATAEATREILEDGGNAFDAALAGLCAATVAEPVLCSLGGGGFLMAQPADGAPCLYDFFVQTPHRRRAAEELDFYPILADFGTATQEFHIGLGSTATPGAIKGLFEVHRDLASLPMRRLVEPAVRLARNGFEVRGIDAYVYRVISPVLMAGAESKAVFGRTDGALYDVGDRFAQTKVADTLEALAREGEALFYAGELGRRLVAACRDDGGQVTAEDLATYRVERRAPLERRYRGARILTNPPPSSGGILIAFALELLSGQEPSRALFGSAEHLSLLTRVMDLTNRARIESRLHEAIDEAEEAAAAARMLDPELVATYAREIAGHAVNSRGTTHLSVVDGAGNVAALSLSNGEGCGTMLPDSGIMLNNMLGEADLNPLGFHVWPENSRISSMMSPSVAFLRDGSLAALGSGGSNRIRTAILQVLINLIHFAQDASAAVDAPRLHFEDGLANLEEGFGPAAREAVARLSDRIMDWPPHSFFFGGVHTVTRAADGRLGAAGDPRRQGVAVKSG